MNELYSSPKEERLPKAALHLWEILLACLALVLIVLTLIIFKPGAVACTVLLVILFTVWVFFGVVYLPLVYHTYRFRLTDTHFMVRRGIFFQREQWMERGKIIYVSRYDSPFTGLMGVTSLMLTASGAQLLLPSMELARAKQIEQALVHGAETESP